MKKLGIILFILFFIITACQGLEEQKEIAIAQDYIHEKFTYVPFTYPIEWEIVSISSDVKLIYLDEEEPENNAFANVPYRYSITFGKASENNMVRKQEIEDFNRGNEWNGRSSRQEYYHSYDAVYATLTISENGFVRPVNKQEGTEEWTIGGDPVLALQNEGEWVINWFMDRKYYDLFIRGDAELTNSDDVKKLFEQMFY